MVFKQMYLLKYCNEEKLRQIRLQKIVFLCWKRKRLEVGMHTLELGWHANH